MSLLSPTGEDNEALNLIMSTAVGFFLLSLLLVGLFVLQDLYKLVSV